MKGPDMLERLFSDALDRLLVRSEHPPKIAAALSGGMDSVVLVHLLAAWRSRRKSCPVLTAVHLNHCLRGAESAEDSEFCRRLAARLDMEFAEQEADALLTARESRCGIEEAGRMLRYRFFHDTAGSGGLVLTGHHADDQAETILMNMKRGAHRRGRSGMRELAWVPVPPGIRVRVGRPLLGIGRESLHAYAVENRLEWREDASNLDPVYTRNRIRHRVMPLLEKIMPGFRERLLEKAACLAREEEAMTERGRLLADALSRRENGGRFLRVHEEALAEPERFIYALRHIAEEELGARLPRGAALSRLAELAASGRLGETVCLPFCLRVRRERDGLFFFFPGRESGEGTQEFILPDPPFDILANGLRLTAEWVSGMPPPADRADPETEWFSAEAIRWPLRLRPPRPGERFRPLGAPGSRKIQDILVDLKIPRRERDIARVLADHAGGIWLWPLRPANRVRLGPQAVRALRMTVRRVDPMHA